MNIAIYRRSKTTEQEERELSLFDQLAEMREWCQKYGYRVEEVRK